MNKILIVFAQFGEAEATISALQAEPVIGEITDIWSEGKVPSLYSFERGLIALSGVGLHPAQMAVARHASSCDEVWNLGFAGCLKQELPLCHLLSIGTIGKYVPIDEERLDSRTSDCMQSTLPLLNLEGANGSLISSDFPIHDSERRDHLAQKWDLVDMEGYGVGYAASYLGKKCRMWKIISDFASPGGRELIRTHKKELVRLLADLIIKELDHAKDHESCTHPHLWRH